jgi:hypothetical protein
MIVNIDSKWPQVTSESRKLYKLAVADSLQGRAAALIIYHALKWLHIVWHTKTPRQNKVLCRTMLDLNDISRLEALLGETGGNRDPDVIDQVGGIIVC